MMEHIQSEQVMSFLMGLNEQFASVRAQILLMVPLPSINKVFLLVIQEERQKSISSTSGNVQDAQLAFAVKGAPPKGKGQKKDRPMCSHCGIVGHTIDKCFKIHGYPPGYKGKGKNSATNHGNQIAVSDKTDVADTCIAVLANHYQLLLALLPLIFPKPTSFLWMWLNLLTMLIQV